MAEREGAVRGFQREVGEPKETQKQIVEREAQKLRAERMRSPAFRVLFEIVNRDPDLKAELMTVLERRQEFIDAVAKPGERHREFAPLLASLNLSPRAERLLNMAIDASVTEESRFFREQIAGGNNYTPQIIIGTGPQAAAYATTYASINPQNPSFHIDQNEKIGGQFAQPDTNMWDLNSRNRPEDIALEDQKYPGQAGSINSLGSRAVLQVSDLTARAYPGQHDVGNATRDNIYLHGRVLAGTELIQAKKNKKTDKSGTVILEIRNPISGDTQELYTDRVTMMSGLGFEVGLETEDPETQQILNEEQAAYKLGKDPKVMTYSQAVKLLGDTTNPFPLKNFKEVIIVGDGDSADVLLGALAGYEGRLGKSVKQLDSVEKFYLVGQKVPKTKEDWLTCKRARYHVAGLELPREDLPDYYHRAVPVVARATRLRRRGSRIEVVASVVDQAGNEVGQEVVSGDHVLFATGFRDRTKEIFAPLYQEPLTDSGEIHKRLSEKSLEVGLKVFYKTGLVAELEVLRINNELSPSILSYGLTGRDGAIAQLDISMDDFNMTRFADRFLKVEDISQLQLGNEEPEDEIVPGMYNQANPVAKKLPGVPVYKAGPAARLPLTEQEIQKTPLLSKIPPNSAALFRTIPYTVDLATQHATFDREQGVVASGLVAAKMDKAPVALPERGRFGETIKQFSFLILVAAEKKAIQTEFNSMDYLRFIIGTRLAAYDFPASIQKLELSIEQVDRRTTFSEYIAKFSPALPLAIQYEDLINRLVNDDIMQTVVAKLIALSGSKKKTDITIPFTSGRVDIGKIAYQIPYTPTTVRKR